MDQHTRQDKTTGVGGKYKGTTQQAGKDNGTYTGMKKVASGSKKK